MSDFLTIKDATLAHEGRLFISIADANTLLCERSTVVYGSKDKLNGFYHMGEQPAEGDTLKALLFNVEPLFKDSADRIVDDLVKWIERSPLTSTLDGCPKDIYDRAKRLRGEK